MTTLPQPPIDVHVRRSGEDYYEAMMALLPQGQAWPRAIELTLSMTIRGLADYWGFVDGRAADLLTAALLLVGPGERVVREGSREFPGRGRTLGVVVFESYPVTLARCAQYVAGVRMVLGIGRSPSGHDGSVPHQLARGYRRCLTIIYVEPRSSWRARASDPDRDGSPRSATFCR